MRRFLLYKITLDQATLVYYHTFFWYTLTAEIIYHSNMHKAELKLCNQVPMNVCCTLLAIKRDISHHRFSWSLFKMAADTVLAKIRKSPAVRNVKLFSISLLLVQLAYHWILLTNTPLMQNSTVCFHRILLWLETWTCFCSMLFSARHLNVCNKYIYFFISFRFKTTLSIFS